MMWIEPCTAVDYQVISNVVGGSEHIAATAEDLDRLVLSSGFTLVNDKVPLACGGITRNWSVRAPNQVGTAWLMMGDAVRYWGSGSARIVRLIRGQLYDLVIDGRYNLVEANVSRYDLQAQKFVEVLGFRFSGLREGFGPSGEDFILYGLRGNHDRIRNRRCRRGRSGGTDECAVGSTVVQGASGSGTL